MVALFVPVCPVTWWSQSPPLFSQVTATDKKGVKVACFVRLINPQNSQGDFCGQVNQSVKYVNSCPQLVILIKTSTSNPSQWFLDLLSNHAWTASSAAQIGLVEDWRTKYFWQCSMIFFLFHTFQSYKLNLLIISEICDQLHIHALYWPGWSY